MLSHDDCAEVEIPQHEPHEEESGVRSGDAVESENLPRAEDLAHQIAHYRGLIAGAKQNEMKDYRLSLRPLLSQYEKAKEIREKRLLEMNLKNPRKVRKLAQLEKLLLFYGGEPDHQREWTEESDSDIDTMGKLFKFIKHSPEKEGEAHESRMTVSEQESDSGPVLSDAEDLSGSEWETASDTDDESLVDDEIHLEPLRGDSEQEETDDTGGKKVGFEKVIKVRYI